MLVLELFQGIYTFFLIEPAVAFARLGLIAVGFLFIFLSYKKILEPLIMLPMGIGMLATGAVAYLIGYPSLKLRGHYLVMATLGFSIIVYILMGELDQYTGGHDGLIGIPPLSIGNFSFDNDLKNFYLI